MTLTSSESCSAAFVASKGRYEDPDMLAEERESRDLVTQIAAASKALEQVGFRLLGVRAHVVPPGSRAVRGRGISGR